MPVSNNIEFTTDREVRSFKPQAKRYTAKCKSVKGLFLDVTTFGVKSWHYRYTLNGKQERLVIGHYPEISLQLATDIRNESALLVNQGISPRQKQKQEKTGKSKAMLFHKYGEMYFKEVIEKERADTTQIRRYLNNDIYPMLGHLPINDITMEDIRAVIWRKKEQGYDSSASHVRGLLKRMFDYAVTLGLVPYNQVLAIPTRHVFKAKSRSRYLSTSEIRSYYTTLLNSRIYRPRKLGLLLSLLTMLRKSELLSAEWKNIDFEKREWIVPNTKADSDTGESRELIVYLSTQVVEILKELKTIAGDEPYVFVGRKKGTHITANAVEDAKKTALRLTDVPHFTIHDLRRTASTHLNEMGFNADVIEKCLNHKTTGVRGVYNRAEYSKERIELMQKWSDFIFDVIYEPNIVFFNEAKKKLAR